MTGTPLPKDPPTLRGNSPTILGAYPQIFRLERKEQAAYDLITKPSADDEKNLIYARILGYLILEGPGDKARSAVALEVNACGGDEVKLLAIGELYFNHYIRGFKMFKGRTPAPSKHASRPSFDTRKAMIKGMLVPAPQNHQQAKANALVRDGFRCVISGLYDANSVIDNKELKQEREAENADVCATECAHIFPESTNAKLSGSNAQPDKADYAAGVWAVLERFGTKQSFNELNGNGIHRLENILTLNHDVHTFFDTLQVWLEPVRADKPNTYKLCAVESFFIHSRWKRVVTFTTPDPVELPVPSPWYLELHAACCRVAHLSGAGECIDKILRDEQNIQVLSEDGASVEVLKYALSRCSQEILVR